MGQVRWSLCKPITDKIDKLCWPVLKAVDTIGNYSK